ncbi:endo-1,4-beta-xylanase [Algibacter lectus]|uniref:Endo-1,4-beta-xylanase A n=1 Tax=Algibacter lectus TaxID=221126 RepID=A0A090VCY2_9FLAO|nr:endo-1,4-beta-xylanase [Algibacter lectus]GAL62645.1 endo-1,4-beta-xylanase A precursor [Algibacter lectus]
MTHRIKNILLVSALILSASSCKNEIKEISKTEIKTTSLKDAFKGDFLIGAALNKSQIEEKDTLSINLIEKEFNTITPENEMKWEQIHPQKDTFYFDIADKYVALGEKTICILLGILWFGIAWRMDAK